MIEAWELNKRSQFENKNPFIPPTLFFECFSLWDCTVVLYITYRYSKTYFEWYPERYSDSEMAMYHMIHEILLNYAPSLRNIRIHGPQ